MEWLSCFTSAIKILWRWTQLSVLLTRIKGEAYLLWKLYFWLFDNATKMPPQKAERMFAMYSKSLLPLLCAHPQQDLVFCSYSSAQFSLASLCKYVVMYQCEWQCLKGILQSNIQSLEVWEEVGRSKSWRRETRNSSEATDMVKGHLGDFGRPLQE